MDPTARLLHCWVMASASVPVSRTPDPVPRILKDIISERRAWQAGRTNIEHCQLLVQFSTCHWIIARVGIPSNAQPISLVITKRLMNHIV